MAWAQIEDQYKEVLSAAATTLRDAGFKRSGPTFRLFSDDCCAIVNFQRSRSNTDGEVRFTINLGVASAWLFEEHKFFETQTFEKVTEPEAHLRERIGFIMPARTDIWWSLTPASSGVKIAREIEGVLRETAIPYLMAHLSNQALMDLWETGKGPGLTAHTRDRYLTELKAALA